MIYSIKVLLLFVDSFLLTFFFALRKAELSTYFNMEDVEKICEILPQVVEYLRSISPVWKDLESGKAKHILC